MRDFDPNRKVSCMSRPSPQKARAGPNFLCSRTGPNRTRRAGLSTINNNIFFFNNLGRALGFTNIIFIGLYEPPCRSHVGVIPPVEDMLCTQLPRELIVSSFRLLLTLDLKDYGASTSFTNCEHHSNRYPISQNYS